MGTTPTVVIGIDPSLRGTGVAVLNFEDGRVLDLQEYRPPFNPVLEAVTWTRSQCWRLFALHPNAVFCMERMIPTRSGNILFYVQMRIMETIIEHNQRVNGPWLMHPLPIQLKSYLRKYGVTDIKRKTPIVAAAKKEVLPTWHRQITSNTADAYFLARLAIDCIRGSWGYNLPQKEIKLVSWGNYNCQRLP